MPTKITRSSLNKTLYIAAQNCLDKRFRNDGEAVRVKRDTACLAMYGVQYDKLTDYQMIDVINDLQVQSGLIAPEMVKTAVASNRQKKILRFYAIYCGLHYVDWDSISIRDTRTGDEMTGYDLKFTMWKLFETRNGWLPPTVFQALHTNWINPKMHEFLIEGGFKKYFENPTRFHWDYLKPKEAQYLITRFQAIYSNIDVRNPFVPGDIKELISEN